MSSCIIGQSVPLGQGIHWVGVCDKANQLHCNPYLIIDGEEAVLIDPGSPLDFEGVFSNVTKLIKIENLKYIILQHQDPDLCASTPLFEEKGFRGAIATHWRASHIIKYYGVNSPFYIVNENQLQLTFGNGRRLQFFLTPYLHFPGAIVTYDPLSKILFTSDLFGAFSDQWALFSDELEVAEQGGSSGYIESMKAFHEHYMPSNDIIRPVMEKFLRLDIKLIAPQHGSIIRKRIKDHIVALRDLECGNFLSPIKKELAQIDGFTGLVNSVLKRFYSSFTLDEVLSIFQGTHIQILPESGLIGDYNSTGRELWHQFFAYIYSKKGLSWLIFIEPLVVKLCQEYEVPLPDIFQSTLLSMEQANLNLNEENQSLKETNQRLAENLQQANDALLKCPVTKLNNEQVFLQYCLAECHSFDEGHPGGSLLLISVDGLAKMNSIHGSAVSNEALKTMAYLLEETLESHFALFRGDGFCFAYYMASTSKQQAGDFAEKLRYQIEQSSQFIEPVTVSISVTNLEELSDKGYANSEDLSALVYLTAQARVQTARMKGGNMVCRTGEVEMAQQVGKVLIVDNDEVYRRVLAEALQDKAVTVLTADDGEAALHLVQMEQPDLIISEALLPKMDGFTLRENLKLDSTTARLPFLLVSFLKDVDSVQRALMLDIEHYFHKPYLLPELIGLVLLKLNNKNR